MGEMKQVHTQKGKNGGHYALKPFEGCLDCPKLNACPLAYYQFPCNFKAIYLRQVERGEVEAE